MIRRLLVLSLALVLTVPAMAQESAQTDVSPTLSEAERAHLVEVLEKSRSELEALVAKASEETWLKSAEKDTWSVGEVVEHLVLAEDALFSMLNNALAAEVDPEWQKIAAAGTQGVESALRDRSQKFQAPEMMQPKAEDSRADMLAKFAKRRAATLDFVLSTDLPLKKHTATGPPGKMNAQQWLALIGAHNLRHNEQIAEVLDKLK